MADAKPDAQNMDSPDQEAAHNRINARWRRILAIGLPLLLALAVTAIVIATLGPAPGVSTPGQSPEPSGSASPAPQTTADPSTPPEEDPAVPTDKEPTPIDEAAPITPGLTAEISRVEAVDGTARGPGEVAGPSLRVTVTINNSSPADAPLNTTVVSAYYGADLTPAPELREPGGAPLPSVVSSGKTVTGVYLFTVPEDERSNVTIMVDYSVDVDPLVFQGNVATLINR
jgi:lipoprotein-anchoring transpeptidase ErfK/SrfK